MGTRLAEQSRSHDEWWESRRWVPPSAIKLADDGKYQPPVGTDFPVFLSCFDFSSDYRLTPSYHDYLEVLYVHKGSGSLTMQGNREPIAAGNVALIGDNIFHSVEHNPESPLRLVALHFLPEAVFTAGDTSEHFEFLRPFFDHSIERRAVIPAEAPATTEIVNALRGIAEEFDAHRQHYRLAILSRLYSLLLSVVRHYDRLSKDLAQYNRIRSKLERLKPVFRYIQDNYNSLLTLDMVADVANMSRSYFCGFFRSVTGNTLTQYLARLRVDKARELLLQSTLNITEIGYEVGFENHSYFDKVFKKHHGVTPLEFRNSQAASADLEGSLRSDDAEESARTTATYLKQLIQEA